MKIKNVGDAIKHLLDIAILAYLIYSIGYAGWQVFALAPEGITGPLYASAKDIDPDLLHSRRLYAIETYVLVIALVIYKLNRQRFWQFKDI
jgi:hypothetical protein